MNQIENLLRSSIGLHAATIGSSVVEHTVRSRMRRLGLVRYEDYLALLRNSPAEWNNLVETMVVTETWFFREKQPFAALVRLVVEEWLPKHPEAPLRLLSVPCASGEEPYSMAMALLDAGLTAGRFRIDAVDISGRALAFAHRGIYGRNSFRGADLEFRNRHFRAHRGGYLLNPGVRKLIRFQRGNLLHHDCLPGSGLYDFIFCRNLLIYFDQPTQNQTVAKLRNLLTEEGVLFTGSAELSLALANGFEAVNAPRSFACRKAAAAAAPVPLTTSARPARALNATVIDEVDEPLVTLAGEEKPDALERARELAEAGQLGEAAELCETHLRERGVSAEAFYLLGLVRAAAGADAQAGEFYRKALYLEPDHLDCLRQWASLSERNGRLEHARILRQRAERRQPDKSPNLWIR